MISFEEADARARLLLEEARARLNDVPRGYLDWTELAGIFYEIAAALADAGVRPGRRAVHAASVEGLHLAIARIEELLASARAARAQRPEHVDAAASRAYAAAQAADDVCRQLARASR